MLPVVFGCRLDLEALHVWLEACALRRPLAKDHEPRTGDDEDHGDQVGDRHTSVIGGDRFTSTAARPHEGREYPEHHSDHAGDDEKLQPPATSSGRVVV